MECNELDATMALLALRLNQAPRFFEPPVDGKHETLALVDDCIHAVDEELSEYSKKRVVSAQSYAVAWFTSMGSNLVQHSDAISLFDFLFSMVSRSSPVDLKGHTSAILSWPLSSACLFVIRFSVI
jgi:hypothetical protein